MRLQTIFGEVVVGRSSDADAHEIIFSPLVVERVRYARSKCASSADAAEMLSILADIHVSPEDVDLITARVAPAGPRTP